MSVEAMKQAQSDAFTHSADCWQWHHECAVAKIKREGKREPLTDDGRVDALRTLSYCAGLTAGWNFCAADDHEGFERAQAATGEAMRVLRTAPPQREPVGINGLTQEETNATASVMGLVNAASTQREPMTEGEISLIAWKRDEGNWDENDWNDLRRQKSWHDGFLAGFREAEAAHGIKGEE